MARLDVIERVVIIGVGYRPRSGGGALETRRICR
jgi:hypothetical protein